MACLVSLPRQVGRPAVPGPGRAGSLGQFRGRTPQQRLRVPDAAQTRRDLRRVRQQHQYVGEDGGIPWGGGQGGVCWPAELRY